MAILFAGIPAAERPWHLSEGDFIRLTQYLVRLCVVFLRRMALILMVPYDGDV
jgi:hypothetical protein